MSWLGNLSGVSGEHRDFSVVGGRIYEWSLCSADGGIDNGNVEMSLLDPATNSPLCHWLVSSTCDEERVRYFAPVSGTVRLMVNNWDCSDAVGTGRVSWRCVNCFGANGSNGCTTAPNGEFPVGAFTPSCNGKPEVVTASAADGTYSTVQLTAGTPTTFSATSNPMVYPTTIWITITNADASVIYGYWPNTRTFNPPYTGTYRFYTHYSQVDMGCDTWWGDFRTVRCGTYDPCTTTPIDCDVEQTIYMHGTGSWPAVSCGTTTGIERIFTYTPSVSGAYRLDVTSTTYPSTGIRYAWKPASLGCDANNWNCLGTAINPASFPFNLTAGVPILILAQAVSADATWQKIALRCAIPQNQSCAAAVPVNSFPATLTAQAHAINSIHYTSCNGLASRTLWYKATGLCGTVSANTCGSGHNTSLAVYAGTCGGLLELACNDNATAGPCPGAQQSHVSWSAQEGTDYYLAVSQPPLSAPSNMVLNISEPDGDGDGIGDACDVIVDLRVVLDGPYDAATGLMDDALRSAGLVPAQEPYTALGHAHVFGGGEMVAPAVLAVTGGNAVVDWVVLELRDAVQPSTVVATRSALLQRDGDVVDVDGVSPVGFKALAGSYKVAVRHRNHLGCMTAQSHALGPASPLIDLRDAAVTTYGTAARRPVAGNVPCQALWSGDVTRDGVLRYTGQGNDRDVVLLRIGGVVPTNTVSGQYLQEDLDLDGIVKYTGLSNDRDIILQSTGGLVPTDTRTEQLP